MASSSRHPRLARAARKAARCTLPISGYLRSDNRVMQRAMVVLFVPPGQEVSFKHAAFLDLSVSQRDGGGEKHIV